MFFFIQITKPRGAAIQLLLQLSGRLQLVMAQVLNFTSSLVIHYYLMCLLVFKLAVHSLQIDRASQNKTQILAYDSQINESEDEEDEEVNEILYGEEDDESEISSEENT